MRVLMNALANSREMVHAIAFSPDCSRIAACVGYNEARTGRTRGRLDLIDLRTAEVLHSFFDGPNYARTVAFSPDGRMVAAGVGDRTIRLWDSSTFLPIAVWKGHSRNVASLAFSPDGTMLASGSADSSHLHDKGEFLLRDVATGSVVAERDDPMGAWSVAFSPDGRFVAVGSDRLVFWSVGFGGVADDLFLNRFARVLTFVPGHPLLVTGSGHKVAFWSSESREPLVSRKGHAHNVCGLAASPDGRTVASCSHDGTVRFWDTGTFRQSACFDWGIGPVRSVAFSPDGTVVAAGGSRENLLILWDLDL